MPVAVPRYLEDLRGTAAAGRVALSTGQEVPAAWSTALRETGGRVGVNRAPDAGVDLDVNGALHVAPAAPLSGHYARLGKTFDYASLSTSAVYANAAQQIGHEGTDLLISAHWSGFYDGQAGNPHIVTLRGRGTHAAPASCQVYDHVAIWEANAMVGYASPPAPFAVDYSNVGSWGFYAAPGWGSGVGGLLHSPGIWEITLGGDGEGENGRGVQVIYPDGAHILPQPVPATANYGAVSIGGVFWDSVGSRWKLGNGYWDGTSTGHFTGNANGTGYALNAQDGFTGDLIHLAISGVTSLKQDYNGNLFLPRTRDGTTQHGKLNLGAGGFLGSAGHFSGHAAGTVLAVNVLSGYTDWLNAQQAGVPFCRAQVTGRVGFGGSAPDLDHWFGVGPRFTDAGLLNLAGHFAVDGEAALLLTGFGSADSGAAPGFYTVRGRGTHASKANATPGDVLFRGDVKGWSGGARQDTWLLKVTADTNYGSSGTNVPVVTTLDVRGDGVAQRQVWKVGSYGEQTIPLAPPATANYGLWNLGNGGFAGGAGHFAGYSGGQYLALNAAAGYAGVLLDFQVAGARVLYANAAGKFLAAGGLGVGNSASATSLGALSKVIQFFDMNGASLGYCPLYASFS